MQFQKWVQEYGGNAKLAATLGIHSRSVDTWRQRKGWPKVAMIIKLLKLGKGNLTFESIVRDTSPKVKGGDA